MPAGSSSSTTSTATMSSLRGASLPAGFGGPLNSLASSTMPPPTPSTSSYHHSHSQSTSSNYQQNYHHASRPSIADRSFASTSSSSFISAGPSTSTSATSATTTSTSTIDSPVATNSAANRSANSAYGLYQGCIALRKNLRRVPGFAEAYLDNAAATGGAEDEQQQQQNPNSPLSPTVPSANTDSATASSVHDPVSHMCRCLRLGSSLCFLFNTLGPEFKTLDVNPDASPSNFKACQRSAAHFVMACNTELGWNDEDIFRIGELYSPDTNGTVKVIHTVTKFVNFLEQRGLLLPPEPEQGPQGSDPTSPPAPGTSLGARGNVVKEILMTERKYVQDLEVLQEYARKLSDDQILSQDTLHNLFLNLNSIVDFARRFLIGIEANACLPPDQQRFGSLFLLMEESFAVYEPYCINYLSASELAGSLAKQENSPLARMSHILDPNELLMFHIKPVQRLLKYHLLFESLAKASDASWPYHQELLQGVDTAKRIADKVNEETRRQENKQAVEELRGRVEDWKGHDLATFGDLLLHETFQVLKSDVEREYHVFLFQKIILCCKDAPPVGKQPKVNKSNSMIRKSGASAGPGQQKRKVPLLLKGRIFINNVNAATPSTRPGSYLLQISWRGDQADEAFSIKCRTPEQLTQWHKAVTKTVEDFAAHRRSRSATGHLSRRLASPHSQFPNTPQSELGPLMAGFSGSSASLNSAAGYGPSTPYGGGSFEDEGDDGYHGDYEPSTGRSTPSFGADRGVPRRGAATQSLPPGARQNGDALHMGGSRPRAQTEDSNSAVIHQWRSQTPNGGYPSVPSVPRQSTGGMSTSGSSQEPTSNLRHSSSRPALRTKQSQEWSSTPMPGPPPSSVSSSSTMTQTAHSQSMRGQSMSQGMDSLSINDSEPLRMLRQNSQGNMPMQHTAPPLRSRSASSPHVYQLPPQQVGQLQQDKQWSPYPIQDVHPAHFAGHNDRQMAGGVQGGGLPLKRNMAANGSTATIASTAGSSTTNPPKRLSSSSTGTDRSSGDSSQSQGLPYISPTSSVSNTALPNGGRPSYASQSGSHTPQPPMSPSSAIKVKVAFGEDTFVIVVLSTITYAELVKKVLHKIHLCGARTSGLDAATLRLRYEDEEGDKILMTADDDVAMAFDWLRTSAGPHNSLVVYAE